MIEREIRKKISKEDKDREIKRHRDIERKRESKCEREKKKYREIGQRIKERKDHIKKRKKCLEQDNRNFF